MNITNNITSGLLTIISFFSFAISAQIPPPPGDIIDKNNISVIAKSFGDSVIIRWAPVNTDAWIKGNAYGYNLFRYKVVENEVNIIDPPIREKINEKPILPMDLKKIEQQYGTDTYAAIVAQAIYGSSFDISSEERNTSILNTASELSNRYSFALFSCDMSVNAAKSHGLIYIDENVKFGEKYLYCVMINYVDSVSPTDSSSIFISVNDTFIIPKPVGVHAGFDGKTVSVSWDATALEEVFTAFDIERSDDGSKTFKKINLRPVINLAHEREKPLKRMMYVDTIPMIEKEYFYRIRGLTPFGETSPPSDTVSGKGEMIIVGVNPIMLKSEYLQKSSLKISWEFPAEHEKNIRGFIVERADKDDGIYKLLTDTLKPSARSFIDTSAQNVNYYQVCALSASKHEYCSFPSLAQIPDSLPPAIPVGLFGKIDSAGIVKLTWGSNKERDFMSYKVYRSNDSDRDFVQINRSEIISESYSDTIPLNNLTKTIYYAVSAQDLNYNESNYCQPLKLIKPDTIPPVPPVIKKYEVNKNIITIFWRASSSNDVASHSIYRRKEYEKEWFKVRTIDNFSEENTFCDSITEFNLNCEYKIVASDQSGLESLNNHSLSVRTGNIIPEENVILKLKPGKTGNSVIISWETKSSDIQKLLIYKSDEELPFVLFRTITPENIELIDSNVKIGQTYSYRVQVVTHNGNRSKLSDSFVIKL